MGAGNWTRGIAAAILLIPGCTYMAAKHDQASGVWDQRIRDAQLQNQEANAQNAQLEMQKRDLDIQLRSVQREVGKDEADLRAIDSKLRDAKAATKEQKAQYQRLKDQYNAIKKQTDAAAAAPASPDLVAQQQELAKLRAQEAAMKDQVQKLSAA